MMAEPDTTDATKQGAEPPLSLAFGPLDVPLLVEQLEMSEVKQPGDDEPVPAYRVTLVAMLPEDAVAQLMALVEDHRVRALLGVEGEVD